MVSPRIHRRLDRLTTALAPQASVGESANELARSPRDEGHDLAVETTKAFSAMIGFYRKHYDLSPDDAQAKAEATPDHCIERALSCEPSQVSWLDIDAVARIDPAKALARWDEIKEAARKEVRTGHRAAKALEGFDSSCWKRARFLAVRTELSVAWRPRNAAEQHLIDQMAQFQELMWSWQESMTAYHQMVLNDTSRAKVRDSKFEPPRLSWIEAMERAARMVERLHALYLRSLESLRHLRRLPPVVVRTAGQVNIGSQQMNMMGASAR